MASYDAPETVGMDSKHCIRLHFLCGEHRATLETYTLGNVTGGSLLSHYADVEDGLSVVIDNEVNKIHAIYDEDDEFYQPHHPCREVNEIRLTHPTREDRIVPLHLAQAYLVSIQIYDYVMDASEHDDLDDNHEEEDSDES